MTPEDYLERLGQLIDAGRDQESLDFAARYQPTVRPPLNAEQLDYVGGMLEMSAMAVAMIEAQARQATRTA
jgi:hypothetical protein